MKTSDARAGASTRSAGLVIVALAQPEQVVDDREPALGRCADVTDTGDGVFAHAAGADRVRRVFVDLVDAPLDDHEHVAQVVRQTRAGSPDQLAALCVLQLVLEHLTLDLCAPFDLREGPFGVTRGAGPSLGHQVHQHQDEGEQRELGDLLRWCVEGRDRPGDERDGDRHPHDQPENELAERQHEWGDHQEDEDRVEPHDDVPGGECGHQCTDQSEIEGKVRAVFGCQPLSDAPCCAREPPRG
jgi:hypothetical protein